MTRKTIIESFYLQRAKIEAQFRDLIYAATTYEQMLEAHRWHDNRILAIEDQLRKRWEDAV